jgi:hypothetical protein
MRRLNFISAIALIVSAGMSCAPALAEVAPGKPNVAQSSLSPPPSNARAIDVQHARQAYKQQLEADLRQKQAMQLVQQKMLDAQQARIGELRTQLIALTQSADGSESSGGGDSADPLAKELPPSVKASRAYGVEIYRAAVLREALLATNRDIASINEYLTRLN